MKRLFALLLVLFIMTSPLSVVAISFNTLSELQSFIRCTPPDTVGSVQVSLAGTVLSIDHTGPNNHHNMLLQVNDPAASAPIGADGPVINVHFRLHVDPVPFSVGDLITVTGSLNPVYSSVMVPFITAETINGEDNF